MTYHNDGLGLFMTQTNSIPVHAKLLVTPACPHCPAMKQVLSDLSKQGKLASLDIVDISVDVARAEAFGVRTVPWLKLNTLELQGAHTESEINHWITQASQEDGRQQLFDSLLEVGQLAQVESMLRREPDGLADLLVLFADNERQINVRIGASAVLESLQGSGLLENAIDEIATYTRHTQVSTRIDACHVLSLIQDAAVIPYLNVALMDINADVREVAKESLEVLAENGFV